MHSRFPGGSAGSNNQDVKTMHLCKTSAKYSGIMPSAQPHRRLTKALNYISYTLWLFTLLPLLVTMTRYSMGKFTS